MIRYIAAALLLTVSPAAAQLPAETCTVFAEGAALIMIVRQRDGDPRELIAIVEATPGDAQPYYRAMIEDAYSWPQFVTPQYQQQAILDFAMRIYSVCRSDAL